MKRIWLLLLLVSSLGGYAQQGTDMRVGLADLSDVWGKGLNASAVPPGAEMVLRIPVINMSQTGVMPAGSCRLEIDLGGGLQMSKGFNLSSAGMGSYFEWSSRVSASGSVVVVGTVKSGIPGDFMGSAVLHLQSTTPGLNLINIKWIYNNPTLKPETAHSISTFEIRTKDQKAGINIARQ